MIQVTYLDHSAFLVELTHHVLLFDPAAITPPPIPAGKSLYVFASHAHSDHYAPAIFQLPAAAFFLGHDIAVEESAASVHSMAPHESCREGDLLVHTLFSTDEGVAFIVECEGACIYHAGDLNDWHWNEDPPAVQQWMKERYVQELQLLAPFAPSVAFVVLDPRLQEHAADGMDAFVANVAASAIVPMHLWGDHALARAYQRSHPQLPIYVYEHPNTSFLLKDLSEKERSSSAEK